MTTYTLNTNTTFNSLEITFTAMPTAEERNALKGLKFRWNPKKSIWYGFATVEEIAKALAGEATQEEKKPAAKPEKVNKHGAKVGDFFVCSWGYDQTNLNYYQITELVGSEYVIIKPVKPIVVTEEYYTSMSKDITIKDPKGKLLEVAPRDVFIDDPDKGLKKKVLNCGTAEKPSLFIKLESYAYAYKQTGDQKHYESWYR